MQQPVATGGVVLIVTSSVIIPPMAVPVLGCRRHMRGSVNLANQIQYRPHEKSQHQQQQHAGMQNILGAGRKPFHFISLKGERTTCLVSVT